MASTLADTEKSIVKTETQTTQTENTEELKEKLDDKRDNKDALELLMSIAKEGLIPGAELAAKGKSVYGSTDERPNRSVYVNGMCLRAALQSKSTDAICKFLLNNDSTGMFMVPMERSYKCTVTGKDQVAHILEERAHNCALFILDGAELLSTGDKFFLESMGIAERPLGTILPEHFKAVIVPESLSSTVKQAFPNVAQLVAKSETLKNYNPSDHIVKKFEIEGEELSSFEKLL